MLGGKICPPAFFVNFARFEETTSLGGSRYLKVVNLIVYPQSWSDIWGLNSILEPPTRNPHINGQICYILVLILAQFRQNKKLSSLCRFVLKVVFECFRWRFIFHFVLCLSPPPLNDSCHKLSTSISSYCAGIVSHTFIPLYASYSFYFWYDMIYLCIFGKGGEKQVC